MPHFRADGIFSIINFFLRLYLYDIKQRHNKRAQELLYEGVSEKIAGLLTHVTADNFPPFLTYYASHFSGKSPLRFYLEIRDVSCRNSNDAIINGGAVGAVDFFSCPGK